MYNYFFDEIIKFTSAFNDYAINYDTRVFKPIIESNGYLIEEYFEEHSIYYKKGDLFIDYSYDDYWIYHFVNFIGTIDIPTQFAGVTVEDLIKVFEMKALFLRPQLISEKEDYGSKVYYNLGENVIDCYFYLDFTITPDNKLKYEIGVYETWF